MHTQSKPSANGRQAGFSFIEIVIVMAIIGVLATMVVALVPMIQERGRQTKSRDNVRNLTMYMIDRRTGKVSGGWPRYNGKNFVLSVVATNDLDRRRKENLEMLFSPGDVLYTLEDVDEKRYEEINKKSLKDGDFHELTSYAGRRNQERDFLITPDQEKIGTLLICDDDDGPLHHPDGIVCGYTGGDVRYKEWAEFDMSKPDPDNPDEFLGDASSNEELQRVLGH
ncbi:MAG: type II secretion system protein [Planctomycetota bacterium]|nr:type II secretion system protein [Planctomycetota bacterium]